jgi:hypothetical protein
MERACPELVSGIGVRQKTKPRATLGACCFTRHPSSVQSLLKRNPPLTQITTHILHI